MAQADGIVDNGSGAVVRADINTQLAAVFTLNSGGTAPSTTYAYMWWVDTSGTPILKQRNATNTGWVSKGLIADTFLTSSDIGSTVQAYDADTAKLDVNQDWTATQRSQATHTATTGGSVTINPETYQNFDYTLSSNITFANPTLTNVIGQKGTINITPSTYSISAMGSNWKRIGSTGAPSTITGRGRIDYHVVGTSRIEYTYADVEA